MHGKNLIHKPPLPPFIFHFLGISYLFYVFYGICTLGGKYLVLVYKLLEKKCIALK